jgi:hypothetical protein
MSFPGEAFSPASLTYFVARGSLAASNDVWTPALMIRLAQLRRTHPGALHVLGTCGDAQHNVALPYA